MRKDREQAVILRKSGMSYSDIKSRMGIPRSTLSKWFKNEKWSNDVARDCVSRARTSGAIRLTVLNAVKRNRLNTICREARQDALLDFEEIKYHPLFISGVISYWMHGDMKSRNRVCFSSADPRKINMFKLFLSNICGVKKITAWVNLQKGNLVFLAESFWADKCGFGNGDMGKTIVSGRSSQFFPGYKRQNVGRIGNKHGVCNLVVNSAYLKNKILKWVELMEQNLINESYFENLS